MKIRDRLHTINASQGFRIAQFAVGILLVIITPLIGILPGPGGIIVFGIGLGLVLRNSIWAKRRYVVFKKQQPKIGRWTDWGLRRKRRKRSD